MLLWQKAHTTAGLKVATERTRHGREASEERRARDTGNRRVRERKPGHMRTELTEMLQCGVKSTQ